MFCTNNVNITRNTLVDNVAKMAISTNNYTRLSFDTLRELSVGDGIKNINALFQEEVVKREGNIYKISPSDELVNDILGKIQSDIVTSDDEKVIVGRDHNVDNFPATSLNLGELGAMLTTPEISEFTYEKLVDFLTKLNPDVKIELIDNLGESGQAYVKDFLVRLNSFDRLKAMPEEVAHFFIELLPNNSDLSNDLSKGIINFPIYSETYNKYKDIYKNENGTPDIERIKKEASAKLVAEYIYALSSNDHSRLGALTKVKEGWIKKWLNKFLSWIGLNLANNTKIYADIAAQILAGDIDTSLNERKSEDEISDKVWYQLTVKQQFEDALTIYELNPPRLLDVFNKFRRDFNDKFMKILRDDKFKNIDQILRADPNDPESLNKLDELSQMLKSVGKIDLEDAATARDAVQGVIQYLQVIDRASVIADAIYKVTINQESAKTFGEAVNNISELESYFSLFESFNNIIGKDLVKILVSEIGKGKDLARDDMDHPGRILIANITQTQNKFRQVNSFIIDKLEGNFSVFFKELLKDTNDNISQELITQLEKEEAKESPNKEIIREIKRKMDRHIESDEKILAMLSGRGKDIDFTSNFNHLINASITNGNLYVSGITKFIQSRLYEAQSKSVDETVTLFEGIDKIEKQLGESVYETAKHISTIEEQYDPSSETGKREVLTFLNPFKGASLAKNNFKKELNDLANKIPKDKNSPEYKEAVDALVAKSKEYEKFQQKYMNRPYTKEFYTLQSEYDNNPDFNEIWTIWKTLASEIRVLENMINDGTADEDVFADLAIKKREKAFLLQETDENNNPKTEDEIKQVNLLKEYFDKGSKFREIDTLQSERAFTSDLIRYEKKVSVGVRAVEEKKLTSIKDVETALKEQLKDSRLRIANDYRVETNNNDGPIDYELVTSLIIEKWVTNNTITEPNEKYWEDMQSLHDELEELQKKGELSQQEIYEKNLYEEKRKLLFGYRNDKRQIDPTLIPQDKIDRINDIEYEIEELKKNRPRSVDFSEFSDEDLELYHVYNDTLKNGKTMGIKLQAQRKLQRLLKKYKNTEKSKQIREIFAIMGAMSTKSPTDFYWEKMDSIFTAYDKFIHELLPDADKNETKILMSELYKFDDAIMNSNAELLDFDVYESGLFQDFMDWMKTDISSQDLYTWFINTHVQKSVWDNSQLAYRNLKYVRSSIYSQSIPNDPEHRKESYTRKHTRLRVKDEYRTGYNPQTKQVDLKVGEHIDNKGEWLPLSVEQGQTDKKYINEDYYKLKNSTDPKDKLRFQYLQQLVKTNLDQQEKVDTKLRQWMNVPVMELDSLEEKQHTYTHAPETVKRTIDKVKGLFSKNDYADADAQLEGVDTTEDIDQFTKQVIREKIPKLGMNQRIPVERVSRNLLGATAAFINRANEFEGRKEAQPVVSALIRLFKNNNLNGANNKQITQIFEKLYSQMILEEVPDSLTNNRFIKRATKMISSATGLRLLMDIPGGLINYGSAQINNMIEAAAGKYMTMRDYAKGNHLAGVMVKNIVADYSKKSNLSYYTLLFDNFDFIQGEFEEDLIQRSSSLGKLASIKSHMMMPRKGGELHAQSATALGIMNKVKVKNQIDGKEYPLHEIYKVQDNHLVLKEGFYEIDKDGNKFYPYNPIDGQKYLSVKKLINRVNLELHGNYAKINQTEASRHSIGKLVENMKRWFATGFTRRWGRELPDVVYEELNEGFYLTGMKAMYNVFLKNALTFNFKNAKDWWNYYAQTPRYKANLRRMGMDLATWGLLFFSFAVGFGYSGDDKDKKLNDASWPSQMAILTLIRMYSEATAYFPVPSMGLQELKRNLFSPLSLPMDTFSNAAAVAQLGWYQTLYAMGDDSLHGDLYYSKDGGYWFSEKGDSKLMKYMLKSIGYNGYFLEPGQYIKDFTKLQGRLK